MPRPARGRHRRRRRRPPVPVRRLRDTPRRGLVRGRPAAAVNTERATAAVAVLPPRAGDGFARLLHPRLVVPHHRVVLEPRERRHLSQHPRRGRGRDRVPAPRRHAHFFDRVLAPVETIHREHDPSERAAAELSNLLKVERVPRRRQRGLGLVGRSRPARPARAVRRRRDDGGQPTLPGARRRRRGEPSPGGRSDDALRRRVDVDVINVDVLSPEPKFRRRPRERRIRRVHARGRRAILRVERPPERAVKMPRTVQKHLAQPPRDDAARAGPSRSHSSERRWPTRRWSICSRLRPGTPPFFFRPPTTSASSSPSSSRIHPSSSSSSSSSSSLASPNECTALPKNESPRTSESTRSEDDPPTEEENAASRAPRRRPSDADAASIASQSLASCESSADSDPEESPESLESLSSIWLSSLSDDASLFAPRPGDTAGADGLVRSTGTLLLFFNVVVVVVVVVAPGAARSSTSTSTSPAGAGVVLVVFVDR
eukprot:7872-Pelagococcus_subviridis.AAC.1